MVGFVLKGYKNIMALRVFRLFRTFSVEKRISEKIRLGLDEKADIKVLDLSGGCGTMLQIEVTSEKFNNLTTIQQQRLVNKCIQNEDLHGFRLTTHPLKTE
jgi:stress-induced morphogen